MWRMWNGFGDKSSAKRPWWIRGCSPAPKSLPSCHLWETSLGRHCTVQGLDSSIRALTTALLLSALELWNGLPCAELGATAALPSHIRPGAGTGQSTSCKFSYTVHTPKAYSCCAALVKD